MIKKKLSPKGQSMRVTFTLPADVAEDSIAIVGDFNDWDPEEHQMDLQPRNGVWKKGISFKPGSEVEFKYYVDGEWYRNDEEADAYIANEHGTENGVLHL